MTAMPILLQALLLILGTVHYSQGQTMLDCDLRPFCQAQEVPTKFLLSQDGDATNVTFTCDVTIPLHVIAISWFFETGNSTGFSGLFPNLFPFNRMFTATIKPLELASNFTFGPVRSKLTVRNVDADQEGIYSCAPSATDMDPRMFQGCLFVLGRGEFVSCSDTDCDNITQIVNRQEDVLIDVRVAFRGGGACANERISQLTVSRDSEVVYTCLNTGGFEGPCNSSDRFLVLNGRNCTADQDCKYFINLQLLDFREADVGLYTVEVLFESLSVEAMVRNITRRYNIGVTEIAAGGSLDSSLLVIIVLLIVVVLMIACIVTITTLITVKWRRDRSRLALPLDDPFGDGVFALPDLRVIHYDDVAQPDHVYESIPNNFPPLDDGYESIQQTCLLGEECYDTISENVEIDALYERILDYELMARYERIPDEDIARILNCRPARSLGIITASQITLAKDDLKDLSGESRYFKTPDTNITEILIEASCVRNGESYYERAQTYERVPNTNIAQLLREISYGALYERVPNVSIARIMREASRENDGEGLYERAQTYERVPKVSIAHILRLASCKSNGESYYESAQTYERVPDVNIARLMREVSRDSNGEDLYERAQTYECVPNADIAQILRRISHVSNVYERAQTYERVPNTDIAEILRQASQNSQGDDLYEKAQTYERVPDADIAQILREASNEDIPYERVPNVDIAQLLREVSCDSTSEEGHYERAQIYECVPDTDIAEILRQASHVESHRDEGAQVYERVPHVDLVQLLREVPIYERVVYDTGTEMLFNDLLTGNFYACKEPPSENDTTSPYDRVHYSEADQEKARNLFASVIGHNSETTPSSTGTDIYERVHYSTEVEQVVQDLLAKDLSCGTMHERVQYSAEIHQMFEKIAEIQTREKEERSSKIKQP